MYDFVTAEEYFTHFLKTLDPFSEKLTNFECLRLKLYLRKKISEDKNKLQIYLLDIFVDVLLGKKEINPFSSRLLLKESESNGLASYLIYFCYKNNVQPFTDNEYVDYIYLAAKNNYYLAYEEIINLYILNKSKLTKEEILSYVNKITDNKLKELYLIYLNQDKGEYNFIDSQKDVNSNKPFSYYVLGKIYEEGIIVKRDINKAINMYKKGAYLNEINSINRLANIYQKGEGVPLNINLALYYFNQASEIDSSYILKLVSLRLKTKDISIEELRQIINSLNKISNVESSILLGKIYLEYPLLKKEKEGLYLISYYALSKPELYFDLYRYYSNKNNRKEAIRNLRRGIVKKDPKCIEEAKGYKKLFSLIH